jgi:hypothetical protein
MPVPEDIYKEDVDFTALALQFPNFAKRYVTSLCVPEHIMVVYSFYICHRGRHEDRKATGEAREVTRGYGLSMAILLTAA